jgi:hypothetical protein
MCPNTNMGKSSKREGDLHTANLLFDVGLAGQFLEGGFDDTGNETQNKVESRFLLNVVVSEGAAVFELLSGEDETLLIRGNTFLILDLLLDRL